MKTSDGQMSSLLENSRWLVRRFRWSITRRRFHPRGRRKSPFFYLKMLYGIAGLAFLVATAVERPSPEFENASKGTEVFVDIAPSSLIWRWLSPSDTPSRELRDSQGDDLGFSSLANVRETDRTWRESFPWGTYQNGKNIKLEMSRGAAQYLRLGALAVVICLGGSALWLLVTEWVARPQLPLPYNPSWLRNWLRDGGRWALDAVDTLPKIFLLIGVYSIGGLSIIKFAVGMGVFLMLGTAAILRARLQYYLSTERYIYALEMGQSPRWIFFRSFLCREALTILIVQMPFAFGGFILYETTISFLKFNLAEMHSWGRMIIENYDVGYGHWSLFIPLLSLMFVVTSLFILTDATRDLFISQES
jgi:ABC-type dipeptide/oligopeptide/nickel transport system permease subunit